jgi:fructose 1,6-bisphosphatase
MKYSYIIRDDLSYELKPGLQLPPSWLKEIHAFAVFTFCQHEAMVFRTKRDAMATLRTLGNHSRYQIERVPNTDF